MGKCGAWPLQNLVTIPKSMTEKGSLLYRGAPGTKQQGQSGSPHPAAHQTVPPTAQQALTPTSEVLISPQAAPLLPVLTCSKFQH